MTAGLRKDTATFARLLAAPGVRAYPALLELGEDLATGMFLCYLWDVSDTTGGVPRRDLDPDTVQRATTLSYGEQRRAENRLHRQGIATRQPVPGDTAPQQLDLDHLAALLTRQREERR